MEPARRGGSHPRYPHAAALGAQLKARREALQLSLQEVGRQVGLSHQQVSKIERGIANTPIETLMSLATVLGIRLQINGDTASLSPYMRSEVPECLSTDMPMSSFKEPRARAQAVTPRSHTLAAWYAAHVACGATLTTVALAVRVAEPCAVS